MSDLESTPYRVSPRDGRFEVRDGSERVLMACRDEGTAVNYADLLNQAYRHGYKNGYRDAKNSNPRIRGQ